LNAAFRSGRGVAGLVRVVLMLAAGTVGTVGAGAQTGTSGGPSVALEALQRLKGMDLEANPALKGAVLKVLESTRGTAQFVEIVRDFSLAGQEAGLLEVAEKLSGESAGAESVRLLLQGEGRSMLRAALGPSTSSPAAARRLALAKALANAADPAGLPLLTELLLDPAADGALRATAVHGLASSQAGAREVLKLSEAGKLDDATRNTASLALAQSRWPDIRSEAARVLPPPRAADGGVLPTIGELVRMRGDAVEGGKVFRGEKAACIKCHRVGTEGVDFGPGLSEIGTKLARQAILESILDPSAGIAFGYEAWSVETRGGDEEFGIIASETAEELALKQQTGVVLRLKKLEVTRREKQKLSVMPSGLAQLLTRQELIDLVEYLTTLKTPPKP
jgi:putative heme-binding domain-containing protein